MAQFAYNNAKNVNTEYTLFKLNFGYHFLVFYKKNINLCFRLKIVEEILFELHELVIVRQKNLHHA